MKKMWKALAVLTAIALFGSAFTACKSDDDGDDDVSVTGVSLDKTTAELEVGATLTLTKTIEPANATNPNVTWSSSNVEVATVENGTVKAVAAGTADITVTTEDGGKTATCTITVKEKTSGSEGEGSGSEGEGGSVMMNGTKYNTIEEAFAAIPSAGSDLYTIELSAGTYKENWLSYKGSNSIKISGKGSAEYGADVVIVGHGKSQADSKQRSFLSIEGSGNLVLENITLKNDFTRVDYDGSSTQAEALGHGSSGTVAAYNCSFLSHQDTIRTVSKSWFYKCYIEGDVDFLWCEASSSVALYENCKIKAVGDEASAAYVVAPKTTSLGKVGKGLVVFNSTLEAANKDTYLFRNPWGENSTSYNNAAFINVQISESGEGKIASALRKSKAMGTTDQKYVGWKVDQTIADAYSGKSADIGVVDADLQTKEYAGRNNIMNRYYDTANAKFVKDGEANWNLANVATENNWTVTEDSSKDLLDGETEIEMVTYLFNSETVSDGVICNGFALESGKAHYKGAAGSSITIPVKGKATVAVYGYYSGNGTIKADTQGEALFAFNNGTTNATVEKDYVVYDANATSVVITAASATYITKVVVSYDASINFVPVTDFEIKADSDKYTVGVAVNLSATVTPENATNKDVKWTSGSEDIATVDEMTGKVTFKTAGEVTFTGTARDGSGISKTLTVTAVESTWTAAEWYTTDNVCATEDGAEGISNFSGSMVYKALSTERKFTNLAGTEISTKYGYKMNGSGKLTFSTTKAATVTIIVATNVGTAAQPGIKAEGSATATLLGEPEEDTAQNLKTYRFSLSDGDTWTIDRSPATSEINPLVYVRVVYNQEWALASAILGGVKGKQFYIAQTGDTATEAPKDLYAHLYADSSSAMGTQAYVQEKITIYGNAEVYVPVHLTSVVTLNYLCNSGSSLTIGGKSGYDSTGATEVNLDCSSSDFTLKDFNGIKYLVLKGTGADSTGTKIYLNKISVITK